MNQTLINASEKDVFTYIVKRMLARGIDISYMPESMMNANSIMFSLESWSRAEYSMPLCEYHDHYKIIMGYSICLFNIFDDVYELMMAGKLPYKNTKELTKKDFKDDSFEKFKNIVEYLLSLPEFYADMENFEPLDHDVMNDQDFQRFYQTCWSGFIKEGKKNWKKAKNEQ